MTGRVEITGVSSYGCFCKKYSVTFGIVFYSLYLSAIEGSNPSLSANYGFQDYQEMIQEMSW